MTGLFIWLIVIGIIVSKVMKQSGNDKSGAKPGGGTVYRTAAPTDGGGAAQSTGNAGSASQAAKKSGERRVMTDADRARLEEYRRKKAKSVSSAAGTNQMRSAAQTDIVERAKANSRKYAGRDETLEELEREHKHSERVGSAVADYVEQERQEHMRMHTEPAPKVEDTSLLGPVEDLMVKGFDGNLSFERDFVGEAADMIAGFLITDQWQPE